MQLHIAEPTPAFHEKLLLWKRGAEVTAIDLRGYETRNEAVLALVAAAEREHALPDFPPVIVHTGDQPINRDHQDWRPLAFASSDGYLDVAVPDFLFHGWPQVGIADYEQASAAVARAGESPASDPRLGWIGNCDTHPIRWELHALGAAHPGELDIADVTWVPGTDGDRLTSAANNHLTLEQQVRRWALLIDVEGRGWSARLKLLLHSGRPVLVQERPWHEFFWPAMIAWEHFIPVRRDLGDLLDRVRWAREHPVEAAAIGARGQAFARERLSRAAAIAEWARTLAAIASEPPRAWAPPPWLPVLEPVVRGLGAFGQ